MFVCLQKDAKQCCDFGSLMVLIVRLGDADQTAFEGVVRFLQKWSGHGPVQGLVG